MSIKKKQFSLCNILSFGLLGFFFSLSYDSIFYEEKEADWFFIEKHHVTYSVTVFLGDFTIDLLTPFHTRHWKETMIS
jgi:hypothetical protein